MKEAVSTTVWKRKNDGKRPGYTEEVLENQN